MDELHSVTIVGPDDPRPNYRAGDTASLVCPRCQEIVHVTEFDENGPIEDPNGYEVLDYVRAHFELEHRLRTWLIRKLSFGWLP